MNPTKCMAEIFFKKIPKIEPNIITKEIKIKMGLQHIDPIASAKKSVVIIYLDKQRHDHPK